MSDPLIIVAEDNPGLARVLSSKLNSSGFESLVCSDGQFAWEAFQENEVAAIMSDQEMPRMCGLELCRKVRAINPTVPFFLVTGREMELAGQGIEEALNIRHIFGKPFSPAEVVHAVREAIAESATAC